jgi:hypothetical protein
VNENDDEAVSIAKLIGEDGHSVVGWAYRWNTGTLAVKWANGPQRVAGSQPELTNIQKHQINYDALARIRGSAGDKS